MNKKFLAILMATLMTATILAGIATVTAEENPMLEEQKEHVTPEQWAEIEELLAENQEKGFLPDLEIIDSTFQSYEGVMGWKLKAKTWNRGFAYAHIFATTFIVDGDSVGNYIYWLGLRSGQSKWGYSYAFSASGEKWCTVWADMENHLIEIYDGNNQCSKWIDF